MLNTCLFAVVRPHIRNRIMKQVFNNKRLQNQAGWCSDSKFKYQQQLELTLSAYNSLICYKLRDDGVSRIHLVVTVKQRRVWWCTDCNHNLLLHWLSSWFGISGTALLWLKSYLSSRSFSAKASNHTSQPLPHSKICVVIVTANLLVQPNSHSYLVAS